jgi:pretoxin HINT domain-containing protein
MKKDDGGTDFGKVGVGLTVGAGMGMAALGVAYEVTPVLVVGAIVLGVGIGFAAAGIGARGSSGGASSGSNTGSSSDSAGGIPSGCFVAGTLVTLGNGSRKAIETVDVGDLVLSQREDGGALGAQRVSHIWEHTVQRTFLLNFSNGEQLETTKEHRFHVDGGGFVPAGRLRPGAALNTPVNNLVLRGAEERNATTQVYNLEVENFHTYFVGDNLVWVHNKKDTEGEGDQTEEDDKNK